MFFCEFIWVVRHGPKAWSNGRGPIQKDCQGSPRSGTFNSPLKQSELSLLVCNRNGTLAKTTTRTVKIFTSPYLRALESVEWILHQYNLPRDDSITIDVNIGEYLGNQKAHSFRTKPCHLPAEYEADVPKILSESWTTFHNRVQHWSLFTLFQHREFADSREPTIVVTHGVVILEILRALKVWTKQHVPTIIMNHHQTPDLSPFGSVRIEFRYRMKKGGTLAEILVEFEPLAPLGTEM